jgi:hypothetical protein
MWPDRSPIPVHYSGKLEAYIYSYYDVIILASIQVHYNG